MANKDYTLPHPDTVVVIDGSSFLYRAYYSLPPMHTPSGQTVHVVYGFCRMLKKLLNQFKPRYCTIVWDPGPEKPTIRHTLYKEYKAQRLASPSDLNSQRALVKEFATEILLHQEERPGIEADDILYSIAQELTQQNRSVLFVTSDKDMRQCLNDKIFIYDPFQEAILDVASVETRYGVPLSKLVFYFALIGDATDNIPGVRGVGPKTAQQLVNQFSSLEDLYGNLEKVEKNRTRELLQTGRGDAFISHELFSLYYYPLALSVESCAFDPENWFKSRGFLEKLHFSSLLKDFPQEPLSKQKSILESSLPLVQAAFRTITSLEELKKICNEIEARGYCALDTETTGLRSLECDIVGISLCVELGTAYYIPLGHKNAEEQLGIESVCSLLRPLFSNPAIKKYLHHAKFDQHVLSRIGLTLEGVAFDTLIAASLVALDGQQINLKMLSEFYLSQSMLTYDHVVKKQSLKDFSEVPLALATTYAAADAHQTLALVPILEKKLTEQDETNLFHTIEVPLIAVLVKMEQEGMPIDIDTLDSLSVQADSGLKTIAEDIHKLLPPGWEHLNLNSPRQLEEILFKGLGLTPLKKTAHKTGFSTDQSVLFELAKQHPVPGLILKYRELFKLKSTYLEGLKQSVNPFTGRIHTSFSQTATATGRLASSEPNLQNIPIGTGAGSLPIRSLFKAPDGSAFLSADYSQIELRVLAYVSQDERLLNLFLSGQDIHTQTAAGLFDISPEVVHSEQRALAKRINFSIMYGLSPFGLSKELDIPYKNAQKYIERYFAQYPGVVAWMATVVEEAKKHGYVQTLWGRRRAVPGINDNNRIAYDLAKRVAINTIIQGSQADLMKLGMLSLDKLLTQKGLRSKLVLQIHDELLLLAPHNELDLLKDLVTTTLEHIVEWNVPLLVTTRTGKDWQEVTK